MSTGDILQASFVSLETDKRYTEAVVTLRDASRLCFCHRVGERWAKAFGPEGNEEDQGLAGELLTAICMFRLNAKHLEVAFNDASSWERKPSGRDVGTLHPGEPG